MAKRQHLKGLDEEDISLIESKMGRHVNTNCVPINEYTTQLKSTCFKLDVKCKNAKQKEFLNNLKDESKEICFGIGSPGTGKSYLSLWYALKAIKEGLFENIVIIVPTAQAGGADLSLGYLKGDFYDKTNAFTEADKYTIKKILKNSGNLTSTEYTNMLFSMGIIRHEFINFLLGKTLDNAIILCNEAEQFTKDNMRLILTRMGENSKIIITGDSAQTNRRSIKNKTDVSGLDYAVEKLSDMKEVSVTEFSEDDIVRNGLITKILQRWE